MEGPTDSPPAARARHARHAKGSLAHVRAIARVPYSPEQLARGRGGRVVAHTRLLGGEVHVRLSDPLPLGKRPFDPSHAGGAGHPRHRDVDPRQPLLLVGLLHVGLPAFTLVRVRLMLYPPI